MSRRQQRATADPATRRAHVVLGGLTTFIHFGNRCGVVLFIIAPSIGGYMLRKPQARGDLLEHLQDPVSQPGH